MLKFYDVDPKYADFLRSYDGQVPQISYSGKEKFLCGIVLNINGFEYYAPVSSFTNKQRTNLQIVDKHGKVLSTLRFCFMFPAQKSVLTEKDFSIIARTDKLYADLLSAEYDFCDQNESLIMQKAASVYAIGCNKNHPFNYTCCDFKTLESVYTKYPS